MSTFMDDLRTAIAKNTVQDGTDTTQATNLTNALGLIRANPMKAPVRVTSTANATLATAFAAAQTVDGIELVAGDRILIKDQTDKKENGIYVVGTGAPARDIDADAGAELTFAFVGVKAGTVGAGKCFRCKTVDPVIGTDNIEFEEWARYTGA